MQQFGKWTAGAIVVCVLAGVGACGGSSNDGGGDSSDAGSNGASGGNGGSSSGSGDNGSGNGTSAGSDNASSGSGTTGLVMGEPIPVEDYYREAARIVCGWLSPCCGALDVPVDEADCATIIEAEFAADYASADPDNFTYDPELGGDCLATARALYDDLGCDLGEAPGSDLDASVNQVCDRVFVGKLEPGAPCAADIECAGEPGDETDCTTLGSDPATVCVVERRAAEGEACYWTCTDEGGAYFCSGAGGDTPALQGRCYTNDQLYCDAGVCARQPATGEPCEPTDICTEGSCVDGVCSPAGQSGDPCQGDSECGDSLYCDETVCAPTKSAGESCESSSECQSGICNGTACSDTTDGGLATALLCAVASGQL